MIELDVRGLSCPQPVLQLQQALEKNDKEVYKILANEAHTVKNLTNFANSKGKKVSSKEIGMEYEIIVE